MTRTMTVARPRSGRETKIDANGRISYVRGSTATLEHLWGMLHASLSLTAGASGSHFDSGPVSHSKPGSSGPDGSPSADLRKLERRWASCYTDESRKEVLRDTVKLYDHLTLPNPDPRTRRGTKEWREAIAHDPRSSREVAKMYGVSHQTVCNFRVEFLGRRRAGAVK